MSQTVQPGAPKESRVAYYMLMGVLGLAFIIILFYAVLMYID